MIKIFPTVEKLNRFAADQFIKLGTAAISENNRYSVALSGGSTPKSLFKLLSGGEYRNKIDWTKIYFFFGDERDVLPDADESNFKMANENLFQPLKISDANIFRWQTELELPEAAAEDYAKKLNDFFNGGENSPNGLPRFDLIFLGMGADGHTASLFPFTEGLKETQKIAVVNHVEKLNADRLTLTFPVINNAKNVVFLVAGADKAESLREVLKGEPQTERFPSQSVKPENGKLFWLIDEKAAEVLQDSKFKI